MARLGDTRGLLLDAPWGAGKPCFRGLPPVCRAERLLLTSWMGCTWSGLESSSRQPTPTKLLRCLLVVVLSTEERRGGESFEGTASASKEGFGPRVCSLSSPPWLFLPSPGLADAAAA